MMMVMTKYPLLLMPAIGLGVDGNNNFLRGGRHLHDIFSIALHEIPSPPSPRRRARADNLLLNEYIHECSEFLASPDVIADGIISQNEFVDFLFMKCRAEEICPLEMNLKFEQLDLNLQLKFIRGICYHENFAELSKCIHDLHSMWLKENTFGFRIDGSDTQSLIHNLCTEVYVDVKKMGLTRTAEPTYRSSAKPPSVEPTATPSTYDPSGSPSMNPPPSPPTASPSVSPTKQPSAKPSESPFSKPSNKPSPTSSATPSVSPTMDPTSNPSRSSILPTFPSYFPPFNPTLAEETSPAPIRSDSLGASPSLSEYQSPSSIPSVLPSVQAIDISTKPPRDTIIVAAAVALALVIVGSVCTVYNRPPQTLNTKKSSFSDPNYEQWYKTMSSAPVARLGLTQSISSSSRDHRFVNVYSSEGKPIPQFNPSTAGAVVIGTVTIGGSSSYSSGFLANECELEFSQRKQTGERVKAYSENGSERSLTSSRSFHLAARQNPRYRRHYLRKQTLSLSHDDGFSSSPNSCKTIPMTLSCGKKKLHAREDISIGDWKAVSFMSSDFLRQCPQQAQASATDTAASMSQRKFFFDLFTVDNEFSEKGSSHSLPIISRQLSYGSSDAGVSSILSGSFFKEDSSYIQRQPIAKSLHSHASVIDSAHAFVPWNKEGFTREMELSDSNKSDSDSSESYVALPLRKKGGLFGRSKKLFTAFRRTTRRKFSFRNRQYQHLRIELHEDPSVVSCLTPNNMFLGTFAAASMPFQLGVPTGVEREPPQEAFAAFPVTHQTDAQSGDLKAKQIIQGEKSDSASAFSHSQFESSKGWSSCSRLSSSSSDDSSSDGSQYYNADLDCSFAAATETDSTCHEIHTMFGESSGESLEATESLEGSQKEESYIGTIDSSVSTSENNSGKSLPHVVSSSSDDTSFPSDELSPAHVAKGVTLNLCQQICDGVIAHVVPNDDEGDDYSDKPVRRNTTIGDESAATATDWAIETEMRNSE